MQTHASSRKHTNVRAYTLTNIKECTLPLQPPTQENDLLPLVVGTTMRAHHWPYISQQYTAGVVQGFPLCECVKF
jgi:hypothetical protein